MDVSGVEIGPGMRLLIPEDGSNPVLFHQQLGGEWCETRLARRALSGSFDGGDVISPKPIVCSGKHMTGVIVMGRWQQIATEDPTDG